MKPISPQERARPLVQTDLFATTTVPTFPSGLQARRDELIDLLSQLLWQVVSQADAVQQLEGDDEQDQS
ncbi:MAG: hypothetical protein DI587_24985 [Variovorax paradoxus]|nr:MAG: hypothetical protein DI583_24985 [Variovorax paradoxus]PZQ05230.1 MAG: hypothetical protein DI587_24985 [Variovorax paradoxus]